MQRPKDAINCILRKKKSDFIPLYDSPWGDAMGKWIAEGYPTDKEGKPCSPNDVFPFDMTGCGGWFDWHAKKKIRKFSKRPRNGK